MRVYIAEFRPRDLSKTPLFWRLALEIIGTGYYHTGMLFQSHDSSRYFEMFEKGYREIPFQSFEQLNQDRGLSQNPQDSIDFVELPREFTQEEIDKMIKWWTDKMKPGMFFGYIRFVELAFARIFRRISEWYYKKTGKVLLFARTEAERSVRVCSSAAAECPKDSIGYDLFEQYDEAIIVPGSFANKYGVVYKGH